MKVIGKLEKLFICETVGLALSVLGIFVVCAYETVHVYDIFNVYDIYAIIIRHALAYNALGCVCSMILTAIIVMIMAVMKEKSK